MSATGIDTIAGQLTDRDRAILRSTYDHRFLTVRQIRTLHFADLAPTSAHRKAKRVLARLRALRVLGALTQRVGGAHAGSDGLIHYVDAAGDRILRNRSGRQARRTYEPSARFVAHRLAVADAHITLIDADRNGLIDLTDSTVEPATWRSYTGIGAARRTLKPDLYAETATEGDMVHAWFIEIDLGTEHIPTLLTKCREYEAYRQTGLEQERHGAFPIVVWSLTHKDPATAERRRDALTAAIAADPRLTTALFRIVAPEGVLPLIQAGGAR
ncbi:replication-relaxation family protein [Mycolicibacterium agri]|nr:replication-relaxation family protein [Mycolicibacterium agri]